MNKTESRTKAIAFIVVPNDFTRKLIILKSVFNGNDSNSAGSSLTKSYRYLFMACFEDVPGAEQKVFNTLYNRFSDISAGLNGSWSLEDARRFIQEAVLEETGIVTCCIPMDFVNAFS